jgi:peptidoglycan/xylan/chitin deacetylase (PgdA/CDA1 family)
MKFRIRREVSKRWARRCLAMANEVPLVSFTFDDFPRSALLQGGEILSNHGLKGTFFGAFGLMGQEGPTGRIFSAEDLAELLEQKHELGCHTFDHFNAWDTDPLEFEASIVRNREALAKYLPMARFRSFSYPISCPRPATKRRIEQYFDCCRGGGQTFNAKKLDLNFLAGFFIEQSRDNFHAIEAVIEQNARERGWLIFVTHDVADKPTRFGCTASLFEKVVHCAIGSGAVVLPVSQALDAVVSTGGLCEQNPAVELRWQA